MSLLRFAARSMLAGHFVLKGWNAYRHPDQVAVAPLAASVGPRVAKVLPEPVAALLPGDERVYVRLCGLAQVVGGTCLATGILRRPGAGLLALTSLSQTVQTNPLRRPAGERGAAFSELATDTALLGGVVLAALDTEGRPNLRWRARLTKQTIQRQAELAKRNAAREAKAAAKAARRVGRRAQAQLEAAR